MDILSALKNELFRPLASVVLPGVLAVAPFVIIAADSIPELATFYREQSSWFMVGVMFAGTIVGMLLEDIGSSIERGIDRCMDLEYLTGHEKVWLAYLSSGVIDNNGRRFLGATVTRLKFINSLMPAMFFFAIGVMWIYCRKGPASSVSLWVFCGSVITLLCWLFRTSTELSEVASITRFCLLDPTVRPIEYDVDAKTVRRTRHFAYAVGELATSRASDIDLRGHNPLAVVPQSVLLFLGLKATRTRPLKGRRGGKGGDE